MMVQCLSFRIPGSILSSVCVIIDIFPVSLWGASGALLSSHLPEACIQMDCYTKLVVGVNEFVNMCVYDTVQRPGF